MKGMSGMRPKKPAMGNMGKGIAQKASGMAKAGGMGKGIGQQVSTAAKAAMPKMPVKGGRTPRP
jgi:hypothetical protein